MRHAIVIDGLVTNVVLWDGKLYDPKTRTGWNPPSGAEALPLPEGSLVGPGWTWDGVEFQKPVTPAEGEQE